MCHKRQVVEKLPDNIGQKNQQGNDHRFIKSSSRKYFAIRRENENDEETEYLKRYGVFIHQSQPNYKSQPHKVFIIFRIEPTQYQQEGHAPEKHIKTHGHKQ